jgi:ABC-2 type transport system ATP-binding protein
MRTGESMSDHLQAIRVERLERRFGSTVAVDALSFTVRPGELFGLLGPDGAGKTTTLRMLAGVLRPTSGDAWVAGASVARDPEAVKPHIAYMSQRFGLYADLTVRENLEFYADLYEVPRALRRERLARLFRFSNLEPFQDRLAGKLSGGMKQKLGLSCALVHEPEVLLLDEPTFGVDPISRRDLWVVVHEMVARGVTVVVSTSYMDEAERFDRVAVLDRGRVLALDAPAALQREVAGRIWEMRTNAPRAARDVAASVTGVRAAVVFGDAVRLVLAPGADPTAGVAGVVAAAARRGVAVHATVAVQPSMEDVFVDRVTAAGAADATQGAGA